MIYFLVNCQLCHQDLDFRMAGHQEELFNTCDCPLYNRWQSSQNFVRNVLEGRQLCRTLEIGSTLEQLFPGINMSQNIDMSQNLTLSQNMYIPPEQLCYRSVQIFRNLRPLSTDCRATFWVSLPEGLLQDLLTSGTLSAEKLTWSLGNVQLALCPRSAVLLSTYSFSITQAQTQLWHEYGHQRITLLALRFNAQVLSNMIQNKTLRCWNRQYIDHFFVLSATARQPVTFFKETLQCAGLATFSCSYNFLAFHMNQYLFNRTLISRRDPQVVELVRVGHLFMPVDFWRTLSDWDSYIPQELLAPLVRARL